MIGFGAIENPWDAARRRRLTRMGQFGRDETLDPDVNYFVESLEHMGALPLASCDGHGDACGFYVLFDASYPLARKIKSAGYFRVEIENDEPPFTGGRFSLRLPPKDGGPCCVKDEKSLAQTLRWAADAWEKKLMPWNRRRFRARKDGSR